MEWLRSNTQGVADTVLLPHAATWDYGFKGGHLLPLQDKCCCSLTPFGNRQNSPILFSMGFLGVFFLGGYGGVFVYVSTFNTQSAKCMLSTNTI